MKVMAAIVTVGALGAGLGLAGCAAGSAAPAASASSSGTSPPAASSPATSPPATSAPAPTATKTVIKTVQAAPTTPAAAPATSAPAAVAPSSAAPSSAPAAPAQAPPGGPNVTDPLAVVFAYYGDIESGNFSQAYALIGNGATTGQSYSEFAAGFTCTGAQDVSENWESGDQVNFDLAATDSCTGDTDYYTGTDTVENGTIVAAQIAQNG